MEGLGRSGKGEPRTSIGNRASCPVQLRPGTPRELDGSSWEIMTSARELDGSSWEIMTSARELDGPTAEAAEEAAAAAAAAEAAAELAAAEVERALMVADCCGWASIAAEAVAVRGPLLPGKAPGVSSPSQGP